MICFGRHDITRTQLLKNGGSVIEVSIWNIKVSREYLVRAGLSAVGNENIFRIAVYDNFGPTNSSSDAIPITGDECEARLQPRM